MAVKSLMPLALRVPVTNVHCPCTKVMHIIFGTATRLNERMEMVFLHA